MNSQRELNARRGVLNIWRQRTEPYTRYLIVDKMKIHGGLWVYTLSESDRILYDPRVLPQNS